MALRSVFPSVKWEEPSCQMEGEPIVPPANHRAAVSPQPPAPQRPRTGVGGIPEHGQKRPTRFPVVLEEPVCPAALTNSHVRGPGGRQVPVVLSQHTGQSRQLSSPQSLVTLAPPVPAYDLAFGTRAVWHDAVHTACAGPAPTPLAPRRSTALPGNGPWFTQIFLVKPCFPSLGDCKADGTLSSPGCWPGAAAAF